MESKALPTFSGRVGLQQRVLPAYRVPFFDALAAVCRGGLSVFAGQPIPDEQVLTAQNLQLAQYSPARNWHFFSVNSPFYQCWQSGLVKWLESWQPEVLIVEANPRYPSTPRAIDWMHARLRPVLGWGLGVPPLSGFMVSWRRRARAGFLKSMDALIAYSHRGAEEYRALGFPPERIFVASNAVAPRPQHLPPARPETFQGQPRVLFVGRLQARKRIDNLLYACAALPEPLRPHLWIVGDGPARAELQTLAQGVYPQAEFTGARHGSELEGYFVAADLFVLPGTGGLAVQQAMAHGLPVIVAQGDGTQDDLVKGDNGWLIPADDLQTLTHTLQMALSDASRLRNMGVNSYRIVAEEVNLEAMVDVFLRALSSVSLSS